MLGYVHPHPNSSEEKWSLESTTKGGGITFLLPKRSEDRKMFSSRPDSHIPQCENLRRFAARRSSSWEPLEESLLHGRTSMEIEERNPGGTPAPFLANPIRNFTAPTNKIGSNSSRVRISLKSHGECSDGKEDHREGLSDSEASSLKTFGVHYQPTCGDSAHAHELLPTERITEDYTHFSVLHGAGKNIVQKPESHCSYPDKSHSIEELWDDDARGSEVSFPHLHCPCSGGDGELLSLQIDRQEGLEISASGLVTEMKNLVEISATLGEHLEIEEESEESDFDYEVGADGGEMKQQSEETDEGDMEENYLVVETGCKDVNSDMEADKQVGAKSCLEGGMDGENGDKKIIGGNDSNSSLEHGDCAWNEDDIWSQERVASSHLKRFPPPISILAKESNPNLPSHMPRVFWRSVKSGGRFVLREAQARPREFFRATRQDGRLRLQLVRPDMDLDHGYEEDGYKDVRESENQDNMALKTVECHSEERVFKSAETGDMVLQAEEYDSEEREFKQAETGDMTLQQAATCHSEEREFEQAETDAMTLRSVQFDSKEKESGQSRDMEGQGIVKCDIEEKESGQSWAMEGQGTLIGGGDENTSSVFEPSYLGAVEKELSLCAVAEESFNSDVATPTSSFGCFQGDCNNRMVDLGGDSTGDRSPQDFRHAQWNGPMGFDNALHLLAPSQSYLQFPFTRMRPIAG